MVQRADSCIVLSLALITVHLIMDIDPRAERTAHIFRTSLTAPSMVLLTSVYGWQPGKSSPVSGANEDDYAVATQVLLWEYQQQLRTSPQDLHANSAGIRADNYLRTIQGRPAEQC